MLKKMMLLVASVCALVAVAAPAAAQAQQLYKIEGGTHVPLAVGAEVTATSTDLTILFSGYANAEATCVKTLITGEVLENKANSARIGNTWLGFEGGCTSPIQNQTVDKITLNANKVGLITGLEFNMMSGECHLSGNPPFTYKHDTNTLTVPATELQMEQSGWTPGWCYYYNKAIMTASFTLTTPTGTPVYIE